MFDGRDQVMWNNKYKSLGVYFIDIYIYYFGSLISKIKKGEVVNRIY